MNQINKTPDWTEQRLPQFMEENFPPRVANKFRAYCRILQDDGMWPKMSEIIDMKNARSTIVLYRGFGVESFQALESLLLKKFNITLKHPSRTDLKKAELELVNGRIFKLESKLAKYVSRRLELIESMNVVKKENL